MLFGDERSVQLYFEGAESSPVNAMRFVYMEVDRGRFTPKILHGGAVPSVEDAPALLPLQRNYEIEEIGTTRDRIDDGRMLQVMKRKIGRGEISVLRDRGAPVALAGVNARFERCCQIGSVYVSPAYRGRGYGHSIVSGSPTGEPASDTVDQFTAPHRGG